MGRKRPTNQGAPHVRLRMIQLPCQHLSQPRAGGGRGLGWWHRPPPLPSVGGARGTLLWVRPLSEWLPGEAMCERD